MMEFPRNKTGLVADTQIHALSNGLRERCPVPTDPGLGNGRSTKVHLWGAQEGPRAKVARSGFHPNEVLAGGIQLRRQGFHGFG